MCIATKPTEAIYSKMYHLMQVYASDCELRWELIWHRTDTFVIAHFIGWVVKAIMIRHAGILWLLSIMWEVTEVIRLFPTLSPGPFCHNITKGPGDEVGLFQGR